MAGLGAWAIALAVSLLIAVVVVGMALRTAPTSAGARRGGRRPRPSRDSFRSAPPAPRPVKRLAIIVNPTKLLNPERARADLTALCETHEWAAPLWLETTVQDPGTGQTAAALDAGVELVCVLGGDGTVRTVAAALAGSNVPMGLLPAGTGNLLARNVDVPIDSLSRALTVALTGTNLPIDLGVLELDGGPEAGGRREGFLVMAGMGFDADIMAGVEDRLKERLGWWAYLVSGAQQLRGPQFKATVRTDDESFTRRTRSVIIGNAGRIQGLALMPDAQLDDGLLDAVVLSPRGVVGWAAVGARLASGRRKGHTQVTHHTSRALDIRTEKPVLVQIDGDPIGQFHHLRASAQQGALLVRVPTEALTPLERQLATLRGLAPVQAGRL